jgi:hypothetical protein
VKLSRVEPGSFLHTVQLTNELTYYSSNVHNNVYIFCHREQHCNVRRPKNRTPRRYSNPRSSDLEAKPPRHTWMYSRKNFHRGLRIDSDHRCSNFAEQIQIQTHVRR